MSLTLTFSLKQKNKHFFLIQAKHTHSAERERECQQGVSHLPEFPIVDQQKSEKSESAILLKQLSIFFHH